MFCRICTACGAALGPDENEGTLKFQTSCGAIAWIPKEIQGKQQHSREKALEMPLPDAKAAGRPAGRFSMCSKSCTLSIFRHKNENTDTGKRKLRKSQQSGKVSRGLMKSKVFSRIASRNCAGSCHRCFPKRMWN